MAQTINISIEFFLMMLFGGITLFVTAPMAWLLYGSIRDQRKLETEIEHFKTDVFTPFKDDVQKNYVRNDVLNRRFDQVSRDISEIKKIQIKIFERMEKKADKE